MIEIIDIVSKQRTESKNSFGLFGFPEYPELQPDDIVFAYCSDPGSQGEKANYVITYTAEVYRVSVFELGVDEFMERVCPFLKNWDYDTMPNLKYYLNPDERFTFKRNDWCWLGLWGAHSLYMHASMTEDFANATKGFNHSDISQKWFDVAVGLVRKMIEDINPIKKRNLCLRTQISIALLKRKKFHISADISRPWKKSRMDGKPITGSGTYFHNSAVWDAVVGLIITESQTDTRHNAILITLYSEDESERLLKHCLNTKIKQHCLSLVISMQ